MGSFDNKTVIVTGGGKEKSIGYAVACAFAQEGANIVLVGANKRKLREARELEAQYGVQVFAVHLVELSAQSIKQAVSSAAERFDGVDVLVNCLQLVKPDLLAESKPQDFEQVLEHGLIAPYLWMRQCYPHLQKSRGCVINFLSAVAASGQPALGALAAASEGLRALSRVASAEWESQGVRVKTMSALAKTAQLQHWARLFSADYDTMLERADVSIADVDEVGRACVELAREV